ncbi:response regulator [Stappia sp.]|uniref:response regulator n=1 Tax=Stappia sp. TaxID=1870903 RepID=UPI003A98ED33
MRILAVDDDPIILDVLTEVLATLGHTDVTVAESAAEALQKVATPQAFDCILLDVQMPNMDGIQLCSALRNMRRYERTPILMITAMSDKSYIDRAFAAGATDYVTKPFDIQEIGARVRVAETLVTERRNLTDKVSVVKKIRDTQTAQKTFSLLDRIPVRDVDGVIEFIALENYILQLSRGSLFGSSVVAFHIPGIERIYENATAFDFQCLITDVAEAVTDALRPSQFLVSYGGNGTFVAVVEAGFRPEVATLQGEIDDILEGMELCYSDGRPIMFNVKVGAPVRLSLRSGRGAIEALRQACSNAEYRDSDARIGAASRWSLGSLMENTG